MDRGARVLFGVFAPRPNEPPAEKIILHRPFSLRPTTSFDIFGVLEDDRGKIEGPRTPPQFALLSLRSLLTFERN
jgi:hypothetical protein